MPISKDKICEKCNMYFLRNKTDEKGKCISVGGKWYNKERDRNFGCMCWRRKPSEMYEEIFE